MKRSRSRLQPVMRAVWLRCPACGRGPLFHGPFTMAPGCSACGYSYKREPGFYLGSIYINYGVTVILTGLLYGFIVLGLRASHRVALAVSLVAAVALPVLFFRQARTFLLAFDNSVNANQSSHEFGAAPDEESLVSGLSTGHIERLKADDGNAGCMMGVVLALIMAFGLLMGGVTLYLAVSQPPAVDGG
jgi:uncharacterized protein (DUF983 family)